MDWEKYNKILNENKDFFEKFFEWRGWYFVHKIIQIWGMLFRSVFILSFACLFILIFIIIDPPSIGNIPFAKLTLNQIFYFFCTIIGVIGLPLFCFAWLVSPPEESSEWEIWGWFGLIIFVLCLFVFSYLIFFT